MQGSRKAPPPPPHVALPEDFQDLHPRGAQKPQGAPAWQPPSEQLLQDRKKEMQAELDAHLRELDSERKEGLYRLDWELAEAIEALHAKHAEKANKMIQQHKETISLMEKRAQAGEELTPDMVLRLRTPLQASAPSSQQPRLREFSVDEEVEEVSEEESEEESVVSVSESEEAQEEGEGIFGRFMNMVRGDTQPQVRRPPQNGRQVYSPNYAAPQQRPAPAPADYYQDASPHRQFVKEGANGSPAATNGFDPSSPLAMISGTLGFSSGTQETPSSMPELPFANGHDISPSGAEPPALLSNALLGLASERSPTTDGVRHPSGRSPNGLPNAPSWPPANVFHGGGY